MELGVHDLPDQLIEFCKFVYLFFASNILIFAARCFISFGNLVSWSRIHPSVIRYRWERAQLVTRNRHDTLAKDYGTIDVSIWLYQLVRGFDSSARPGSNMFLLGLFHRICKLLFYRIKPIFVFDGGVPSLKKKTIAARQKGRRRAQESIEKVRQQLLENLIKQQALGDVLGENVKIPKQFTSKQDELFWLPPVSEGETISRLEEEESDSEDEQMTRRYAGDLNSVDVTSEDFLKLPADVRHDILTDLKETRKLNSWAKIHLMPEEADDFSSFQMGRLLKRRAVQAGLDKAAEELGVRGLTVNDLESILSEQGIDLSQRIAGDSSTRFVYSSNLNMKIAVYKIYAMPKLGDFGRVIAQLGGNKFIAISLCHGIEGRCFNQDSSGR
ncbi:hypothetical protein GE061_009776 [Apolygus lucorum]|uniref:XPG N-terminal domain-containing protein n=1 Tax=Apolygus lucorum TaxID=248454 RepID=A0A8S9Y1G0_APOLU|nr:hypothetical protein GE061_009776 [Apolygus lucorum]